MNECSYAKDVYGDNSKLYPVAVTDIGECQLYTSNRLISYEYNK